MRAAELSYPVLVVDEVQYSLAVARSQRALTFSSHWRASLDDRHVLIDSQGRCLHAQGVNGFAFSPSWRDNIGLWLIAARFADYDLVQTATLDWPAVQEKMIDTEWKSMEPEFDSPDFEGLPHEETLRGAFDHFAKQVRNARAIADLMPNLEDLISDFQGRSGISWEREGRAHRREYWHHVLIACLSTTLVLATFIAFMWGWYALQHRFGPFTVWGPFYFLWAMTYCFLFAWGVFLFDAAVNRRLRDLGVDPKWRLAFYILNTAAFGALLSVHARVHVIALVLFCPLIIMTILLGLIPGARGDNRYGSVEVWRSSAKDPR